MTQCSVFGCNNNSSTNKECSYHRIPSKLSQTQLRKLWINRIGRKNWTPASNAVVCSKHFLESDFVEDMQARLMGTKPKKILKGKV